MTAKKHLLPYGMKLFLFYVLELILSVAFLFSQLIVRSVESLKQELLQSKINLADTYASLPENEFQPPEGIPNIFLIIKGCRPQSFGQRQQGPGADYHP